MCVSWAQHGYEKPKPVDITGLQQMKDWCCVCVCVYGGWWGPVDLIFVTSILYENPLQLWKIHQKKHCTALFSVIRYPQSGGVCTEANSVNVWMDFLIVMGLAFLAVDIYQLRLDLFMSQCNAPLPPTHLHNNPSTICSSFFTTSVSLDRLVLLFLHFLTSSTLTFLLLLPIFLLILV